jgi:hypothetical protein
MKLHNGGIKFFPALVLTALVGLAYGYSNMERVNAGYFASGFWITVNSILYVAFFGLLSGTLLAYILGNLKTRQKRSR